MRLSDLPVVNCPECDGDGGIRGPEQDEMLFVCQRCLGDGEVPDCAFCEITWGRRASSTWERGICSFEPLNPVTEGHRLFVPTRHAEHPSADVVAEAMRAAARYGEMRSEDFNLITSSGSAATQTIQHVHVHYVPRREGDGLTLPWTGQKRGDQS